VYTYVPVDINIIKTSFKAGEFIFFKFILQTSTRLLQIQEVKASSTH